MRNSLKKKKKQASEKTWLNLEVKKMWQLSSSVVLAVIHCMIEHFSWTISALFENKTQATESRFRDHLFYNESVKMSTLGSSHAKQFSYTPG